MHLKRTMLFIVCPLLLFLTVIAGAQSAGASGTSPEVLAWIDRTMERYMAENNIPALVAGVVRDGRVEAFISKGAMSRDSGRPVDEHAVFQLASLSKSFTGTLANHLAAVGQVDLHAPITVYLPREVVAANGPTLARLTLRDLLHHRTRLPRDAPSLQPTPFGRPLTRAYTEAELLKDLKELKIDTAAQDRFSYSNFAFGLAGYLLERATGQSYESLLQTYIANELGMSSTTTELTAQLRARLVVPYLPHRRKKDTQAWVFGKMSPAGGVFSTVSDLSQFMIRQMEAYRQYEETGARCSFVLTHDKAPMDASGRSFYGYGLFENRNSTDTTIVQLSHGGDVDGFVSNYSFSPTRGVGLILLSSSGGTWFWELERILNRKLLGLPVREAIAVNKKALKRYVGQYDFGHLVLTISRKGDQLWTQTPGYPKQKLYPESDRKFFHHAFDAQIEFVLNDRREIEKVIYTQDGHTAYPRKIRN